MSYHQYCPQTFIPQNLLLDLQTSQQGYRLCSNHDFFSHFQSNYYFHTLETNLKTPLILNTTFIYKATKVSLNLN